ncbi:hypothetical protein [Actinoallomurus sp. CA-142502]|uniref:hypothetical protein n=1 Tax=Actinoallomurus sp. CA-142502 TaxID=3239885 RepID=UPI003D8FF673
MAVSLTAVPNARAEAIADATSIRIRTVTVRSVIAHLPDHHVRRGSKNRARVSSYAAAACWTAVQAWQRVGGSTR